MGVRRAGRITNATHILKIKICARKNMRPTHWYIQSFVHAYKGHYIFTYIHNQLRLYLYIRTDIIYPPNVIRFCFGTGTVWILKVYIKILQWSSRTFCKYSRPNIFQTNYFYFEMTIFFCEFCEVGGGTTMRCGGGCPLCNWKLLCNGLTVHWEECKKSLYKNLQRRLH